MSFLANTFRVSTRYAYRAAYRPAYTMMARHYAEGQKGVIPDLETQVAGHEKMEMEALKAGKKSPFASNQGVLKGPFGTADKPVLVPSVFSSRIVGCTGGSGDTSHEILWHEIREGETIVCMACAQHFKLQKVDE